MPMTYDEYQTKRSFIVDTAETPAQQRKLKADLARLKAQYDAQKTAAKPKVKAGTPDIARKQATDRAQMLRGESEDDKAYRLLMESVNYDVTKIPGFRGGKGTR